MLLFLFFLSCCAQAEVFFTQAMMDEHLTAYSERERALIEKDLAIVRSVCLEGAQNTEPKFYLATAGAPGSRKTTLLERFVATHPEYQGGVYLDPDPRSLKFMAHTYYNESLTPLRIAEAPDYNSVIKSAYDRWAHASTYIVLRLFEEACGLGRSIIHGTTSTGAHTPQFYRRMKEEGYEITLLLCSCPDAVKRQFIEYRNQVVRFYQSSPEDALAKAKAFPQRFAAYFAYADRLYFFWSDSIDTPERLAATWHHNTLTILDPEAFDCFRAQYEQDRALLAEEGTHIPSFSTYFSDN